MSTYYFYIARCLDGTLYVGSTGDTLKRIKRHNLGQGAKWIRQHGAAVIVYTEEYDTLAEARRREKQIKGWSRVKKENLISGKWGRMPTALRQRPHGESERVVI